jgi:hypothetical protein
MKEDIKALDRMRDALLTNHDNIIAGKDLKQSSTVIANANALSNVVSTKLKMIKAEESNSKAIRNLGGK